MSSADAVSLTSLAARLTKLETTVNAIINNTGRLDGAFLVLTKITPFSPCHFKARSLLNQDAFRWEKQADDIEGSICSATTAFTLPAPFVEAAAALNVERVRTTFITRPEPCISSPSDSSPLSSSLVEALLSVTGPDPTPWLSLIFKHKDLKDHPSIAHEARDTSGQRDQSNARSTHPNLKTIAPVDQVAALVSALWPSFGSESNPAALPILVLTCQCKANEKARSTVWESSCLEALLNETCRLLLSQQVEGKQGNASNAGAQFLWFLSRTPPPPASDVLSSSCWDLASALVHGLKGTDPDTSLACALALSNLSTASLSLRRGCLSRDGPLALITLIKESIGQVQEASAAALMSLTATISGNNEDQDLLLEQICDSILEAGGAEVLVDCARNGDPVVQSTVIGVLQNLSCINGGGGGREERICARGSTIALLIDIIQGLGSEEAIISGLHTLSNLALSKVTHPFFTAADALPALLHFFHQTKINRPQAKTPDECYDLAVDILGNLCRYGDRSLRLELAHQGTIFALKEATSSPAKDAALSALISLSAEPSLALSIVETDGLVGCLLHMVLSAPGDSERAIKVLANLSLADSSVKQSLLNAGLPNVLSISIAALSRSTVATSSLSQLAACKAVMNLGRDSEARRQFATTTIIPTILRLVTKLSASPPSDSTAKVQDAALGALYHLMAGRSLLAQVVKSGGIKAMAQILSSKTPSPHQKKAGRILRRVAMHGDEASRRELVERLDQAFQKAKPVSIIIKS
jgi:hypothetical protein